MQAWQRNSMHHAVADLKVEAGAKVGAGLIGGHVRGIVHVVEGVDVQRYVVHG